MSERPAEPLSGGRLTSEPVRWAWVIYGFVSAVISVLLLASVISEVAGGIIVGVSAAAYAAVSELFVRGEVVPLRTLEELAAAEPTSYPEPTTYAESTTYADDAEPADPPPEA